VRGWLVGIQNRSKEQLELSQKTKLKIKDKRAVSCCKAEFQHTNPTVS
jgi:hypothetical protein